MSNIGKVNSINIKVGGFTWLDQQT